MRNRICFILFFAFVQTSIAQDVISLNKAVEIALKNNFDLLVAGNDAQQAHNNNIPGNAGMLPSISLNVTDNPALSNINQKFTNGTTIERNNVFSNSLGASINLSYTLFDGNRMFATRRKLEFIDLAAENSFKSQVQQVIVSVVFNYSNIVRHTQYLDVLKQLEDLSLQRLENVQVREKAGLANNADLFLAQLDMETRKQLVLSQEALIKKSFADLNVLLNIKSDSIYKTEVVDFKAGSLKKVDLDSMLKNNPDWLLANYQYEIALQTQKEIEAAKLPLVRLNAAYNYNLSQSQAGFSLYSQTTGPQAGLTLSIPLFTGGVNNANIENAKLGVQSSEYRREQIKLRISSLLEQAWIDYTTAVAQLKSDSSSLETAKSYITIMQARFDLGQSTLIELREAQRTYEETVYRYYSNLYFARLAETQLLGLTGQLVQ